MGAMYMNDKSYYQKKNRLDKVKLNWKMILLVFSVVLFMVFMVTATALSEKQNKDLCAKVGGEYKIIDTKLVNAGKGLMEVDVYGCVK